MNQKAIAVVLALVVVVGAWYVHMLPGQMQQPSVAAKLYESSEVGLRFSYPSLYTLTQRPDGVNGWKAHVLTLIDASTTVPDMSEGPTAISVIEIDVTPSGSLEEWVRNNSVSNFSLSPDKEFSSTTVGGEPALAYRYSGLYESDAVAVLHNARVYLFAASWMKADDRIRTDFKNMLSSVQFTQ